MDEEELIKQRGSLREKLNELHNQMVPLESALDSLSKSYSITYKQYLAVDTKIAKSDGRFKTCPPFTSGKKPKSYAADPVKVLTTKQLDLLIKKLEKEIEEKKR